MFGLTYEITKNYKNNFKKRERKKASIIFHTKRGIGFHEKNFNRHGKVELSSSKKMDEHEDHRTSRVGLLLLLLLLSIGSIELALKASNVSRGAKHSCHQKLSTTNNNSRVPCMKEDDEKVAPRLPPFCFLFGSEELDPMSSFNGVCRKMVMMRNPTLHGQQRDRSEKQRLKDHTIVS